MSVFTRINDLENSFSKTESKLAEYIINNSERLPTLTSHQIAEEAGCSAATVVRFTKKMGYPSLTEFKIALSTENKVSDELVFSSIDESNSFTTLKKRITQNGQFVLKETADLIQESMIKKIITRLNKSETIYVFGVGASILAAEDIVQKWARIGKNIILERDMNVLVPRLSSGTDSKLLFLISNSGETPEVVVLAELAKKLGIEIITLTKLGTNSLNKLADFSLQTSQPKESYNRSAATNSLLSQFLTIDILFYSYLNQYKSELNQIANTKVQLDYFKNKLYKKEKSEHQWGN